MAIEQVIPGILEHVDIEKWGPRKAQLVRLVAVLQSGPDPAPLGRRLLVALGRTPDQARYDHKVLVGLADDGVLMRWRGTGRRPDCWAVANLERWRHVVWLSRRRDVLAAFSGPWAGDGVLLWGERAGREVGLGGVDPVIAALAADGLSANQHPPTKLHHPLTPQNAGETPPPTPPNDTAASPPIPSVFYSEFTHSLPSQPSEGGSESSTGKDDPGDRLLAAVRSVVKSKILGSNADRIRRVGRSTSHLDALMADVANFWWIKTGSGAAQAVEDAAGALDYVGAYLQAAAPDPAARAEVVRRLIVTCTELGDEERAAELRAELDQLTQPAAG